MVEPSVDVDTSRAPGSPLLEAFGDLDDHLRIVAALGRILGHLEPDAAKACVTATDNTWERRRAGLQGLLAKAYLVQPGAPSRPVRLRDPDALEPVSSSERRRWDDAGFHQQKRALLGDLVDASNRGVIVFVRPCPTAKKLRHLPLHARLEDSLSASGTKAPDSGAALTASLSPDLRPIAAWLLASRIYDPVDLSSLLASSEGEEELVAAAWARLRPSAQCAAASLCLVRPPMAINGQVGPFARMEAAAIDRRFGGRVASAAVAELRGCGFLQDDPAWPDHLRVPRPVRRFVQRLRLAYEPLVQDTHLFLAALPDDGATQAPLSEQHHHAICSGDLRRATETAVHYGTDLRAIARRLSQAEERYDDAADVYQAIVDRFDREDAYAWEYLGWNLLQPFRQNLAQMPELRRSRILRSFERACELDGDNPLFRGRLLRYRAQSGEDIGPELDHWMIHFFPPSHRAHRTQLTWFVEPVVKGLRYAKRTDVADAFVARWRERLPGIVEAADGRHAGK